MATLVLTTVGTALGGPLGGAFGGLVGQTIDRGLLGGVGRGPRLGDLSVQTSSYGSAIPRIYGRMRVAGTVVWATDVREEEAVEGGGKEPQRTGYSYSVSIAVALSSRPIAAIQRIWADGKLIRGASGEFTVRTKFRTVSGSEDQPLDPLIASIETITMTPAYRGLALAIFEDLDLTEFGNRIPMLTFEVSGDEGPVALGQMLADASGGLIDTPDARPIAGFAAYGSSRAESVASLIELCGLQLAERDGKLSGPSQVPPTQIQPHELGCDADGESRPAVDRVREPDSALPASLLLGYHDPDRDYLAGQMRASSGGGGARDEQLELPAVLAAETAKQWAEAGLARRWRAADRIRLRLPPTRIGLRPGDAIQLPDSSRPLVVKSATINGMAVAIDAVQAGAEISPLPADPGRVISDPDIPIGRSSIGLFELPSRGDAPEAIARPFVAASSQDGWRQLPIELRAGSGTPFFIGVWRRAVLGVAQSVLEARNPAILDRLSTVTIRLANPKHLLLNADLEALAAGANLAIIGDELIQFGQAEQLAPGLFRLSNLLRGRRGTEWAALSHGPGEAFCLVDPAAMLPVDLPASAVGQAFKATAHGIGDHAPLPSAQRTIGGEAMRPPSICHLRVRRDSAMLHASWVRRSHRSWTWNDDAGTGGDDFPERYRVIAAGPLGLISAECTFPEASFALPELPAQSGQQIELTVQTIGSIATSRPRSASISL